MFSALVFGLFFTPAHAQNQALSAPELISKNSAIEKVVKAIEEAAEIECYPQVADPATVVQKDSDGAAIVWKVVIPCRLRESVGAELENLELTYLFKDQRPVLYTSELRLQNKK